MDSADVLQDFLKRLRLVNSVLLVCNSVFSSIHAKSVFKSVFTVERLYPNGIESELSLDGVNSSYAEIELVRRLIEEIFSLSCCSNEVLASQIVLYCKHDKERHEETDPARRVKTLLERLRFVKELLTKSSLYSSCVFLFNELHSLLGIGGLSTDLGSLRESSLSLDGISQHDLITLLNAACKLDVEFSYKETLVKIAESMLAALGRELVGGLSEEIHCFFWAYAANKKNISREVFPEEIYVVLLLAQACVAGDFSRAYALLSGFFNKKFKDEADSVDSHEFFEESKSGVLGFLAVINQLDFCFKHAFLLGYDSDYDSGLTDDRYSEVCIRTFQAYKETQQVLLDKSQEGQSVFVFEVLGEEYVAFENTGSACGGGWGPRSDGTTQTYTRAFLIEDRIFLVHDISNVACLWPCFFLYLEKLVHELASINKANSPNDLTRLLYALMSRNKIDKRALLSLLNVYRAVTRSESGWKEKFSSFIEERIFPGDLNKDLKNCLVEFLFGKPFNLEKIAREGQGRLQIIEEILEFVDRAYLRRNSIQAVYSAQLEKVFESKVSGGVAVHRELTSMLSLHAVVSTDLNALLEFNFDSSVAGWVTLFTSWLSRDCLEDGSHMAACLFKVLPQQFGDLHESLMTPLKLFVGHFDISKEAMLILLSIVKSLSDGCDDYIGLLAKFIVKITPFPEEGLIKQIKGFLSAASSEMDVKRRLYFLFAFAKNYEGTDFKALYRSLFEFFCESWQGRKKSELNSKFESELLALILEQEGSRQDVLKLLTIVGNINLPTTTYSKSLAEIIKSIQLDCSSFKERTAAFIQLACLLHQYDYTDLLQDSLRACDDPAMAAAVHAACQHRQGIESFNAFKVIKDKLKKHNDVKIYQRAFELYGGWAKRYSTKGCLTNVIKGAMVVPSTSVDTRCSSEKLYKPAEETKANVVNGCQSLVEQSSSQVGSTSVAEELPHAGAGIGVPVGFWKPQEDKSLHENTVPVKPKSNVTRN
jgi:hypothetical protein